MKILIVTSYLPWPLDSGGNAAQFFTLKALEGDHEFTIIYPTYDNASMVHAHELQETLPGLRVLPVYCGDKASGSTREIIKRSLKTALNIVRSTHAGVSSPPEVDATIRWPGLLSKEFVNTVSNEIGRGCDLIQVEFIDMLSLGPWLPSSIPSVFIHHQIHFAFTRQQLDHSGRTTYSNYVEAVRQSEERSLLRHFTGVIVFSESDRMELASAVEQDRLHVSPFPIPANTLNSVSHSSGNFDGRFTFVGSGEHFPNYDGVEWLVSQVWPQILGHQPQARLEIVGKWTDDAKKKLSSVGVHFTGFVPELTEFLAGSIMLVPIRIASGIRTKILMAMADGVPIITTSAGCKGMAVKSGEHMLVVDSADAFATEAVRLAKDPALYQVLSEGGRSFAVAKYSAAAVRGRRNEIYREVLAANERDSG